MVLVHPSRIVLNRITPQLSDVLESIRDDLEGGEVYKWTMARNGTLMLGRSRYRCGKKTYWGHPTLVGGLREPEARMGGELRFGMLAGDLAPTLYINNDSGRYSEYVDRVREHLKNVGDRFRELGLPVKEQWIDKPAVALVHHKERPATVSAPALARK